MITAETLPVTNAPATTSAFDQVKQTAITVAHWLSRQVQWIAGSLKDIVLKIIEAVKPAFIALAKLAREQASKVKGFINANQPVAYALAIAIPAVAAITIFISSFFGKDKGVQEPLPQE